ncbi:hypothetical protein MTR67_019084 [Solanum verrucosum]|uniref:Cytochrome P450 n=1 Tax=Solanum verrucosum TaxID=315347 RepID=A0AAF0QTL1_SOLVR|nr:hypothetical protein MTR67_019084 [Solanum verrucosum]
MDTTASSTEWILTELLRHPQVMKKLQKELQEVVGLERMVEESDLENLKYLNMVVKEGLRLHPVVPLFYHESMEDCVVDGFHIQKGSRVMVNCYAAQRDPNVWPEPEKFLPEICWKLYRFSWTGLSTCTIWLWEKKLSWNAAGSYRHPPCGGTVGALL